MSCQPSAPCADPGLTACFECREAPVLVPDTPIIILGRDSVPPSFPPLLHMECGETIEADIIVSSQRSYYRTASTASNQSYYSRLIVIRADEIGHHKLIVTTNAFDPVITIERFVGHRYQVFGSVLEWDTTAADVGPWIVEVTTVEPFDIGHFSIEYVCAEEPAVLFRRQIWAWKEYSGFNNLLPHTFVPRTIFGYGDSFPCDGGGGELGGLPFANSPFMVPFIDVNRLLLVIDTHYKIIDKYNYNITTDDFNIVTEFHVRARTIATANKLTGVRFISRSSGVSDGTDDSKFPLNEYAQVLNCRLSAGLRPNNFPTPGYDLGTFVDTVTHHTPTHFRREFFVEDHPTLVLLEPEVFRRTLEFSGDLEITLSTDYSETELRDDLKKLMDSVKFYPEAGEGLWTNNLADPDVDGVPFTDQTKQMPIIPGFDLQTEDGVHVYVQPVTYNREDSSIVAGKLTSPYDSAADIRDQVNYRPHVEFILEPHPRFADGGFFLGSTPIGPNMGPTPPPFVFQLWLPEMSPPINSGLGFGWNSDYKNVIASAYKTRIPMLNTKYAKQIRPVSFPPIPNLGAVTCTNNSPTGNKYLDVEPDWTMQSHLIAIKHDGIC